MRSVDEFYCKIDHSPLGKIDDVKEAMSGQMIEPGETHYKSTECGAIVCKESYSELEEVGIVMCPKIDSWKDLTKSNLENFLKITHSEHCIQIEMRSFPT
ncbi:MAG: hypothetical protein ACXAEU_10875 [Candidatus Hodarchaeales archaeon]|jgi:hypothetical protein